MGHDIDMRMTAKAALATCAAALLCLVFASSALATDEHLFDPVLSLEGRCTAEDGVADPGCPYAEPSEGGPRTIENPCGTAVDSHGDIYVANMTPKTTTEGWIDIFDPEGKFITRIDADEQQPCRLAVDSQGNLYMETGVHEERGIHGTVYKVELYEPDSYPPTASTDFGSPETVIVEEQLECGALAANGVTTTPSSIAVDPSDDHLYVALGCEVAELGSAAEGSPLIDESIGLEQGSALSSVAIGRGHDVYVGGATRTEVAEPRIFVFDGEDSHLKCEIDGAETPAGRFDFRFGQSGVGADHSNGDLYVANVGSTYHEIDQFGVEGEECRYIGTLPETSPKALKPPQFAAQVAVDAPVEGEEGYDSPNEGYVYVGSGEATKAHLYAFEPRFVGPPRIRAQSAAEIETGEADLRAEVSPHGLFTTYRFEYVSQADFEASGYAKASRVPAAEASLGEGGAFLAVSAPIAGLAPATGYRLRVVAINHCKASEPEATCVTTGEGKEGKEGKDVAFSTYVDDAGLPDGRAYELVTPPDTNGRIPTMVALGQSFASPGFDTGLASLDGQGLVFGTEGGSLPGLGGGGFHDTYEAVRGDDGWSSHLTGPSGAQASQPSPGGIAAGHSYSLWGMEGEGTLPVSGSLWATYLRRPGGVDPACSPEPEGQFEFVGCGSLGVEPRAQGRWIGGDGSHVVFVTGNEAVRLEPDAPPTGTAAVYDRSPDGLTHVVSLLPGDVTPAAGEQAVYQGASADGSAVAFEIEGHLYVRLDDERTLEAASGETVFGGLSRDGSRLFYLRPNASEPQLEEGLIPQGELFAFDSSGEGASVPIGSGTEAVLVNVSADGSHAYFVSPQVLDEAEEAKAGAENLYVWNGATVAFVATVGEEDLIGEEGNAGGARVGGLGLWVTDARSPSQGPYDGPANDPSRTTADGAALIFQSRARLTSYENGGHAEIYRYEEAAAPGERLRCVSCNPTGSPAASDAELESETPKEFVPFPPVNALSHIENVTRDGARVFFQSADRLAAADRDGRIDVYEWQAPGTGGCSLGAGCIHLISGGRSHGDDYLYAMTPDGHDVFFESGDLLTTEDRDATPSIYDARVGGGFPFAPAPPGECLGEACQPTVVSTQDVTPSSLSFRGAGNLSTHHRKSCPRGKRRVRRHGKPRCVARHRNRHHRHRKHHRHTRTHAKRGRTR